MSIDEKLDRYREGGLLLPYRHPAEGMFSRRLFLSDRLAREIQDGRSSIGFFGQKNAVVVLFDRWVLGQRLHVRLSGRSSACAMALLEPPPIEIWEFRITEPRPQLRVFCRFAAPDVLVALVARNRDGLGPADRKRGERSRGWREAMHECEAEWNRIFGGAEPFRGRALSDYIRRNARECA